MALNVGGSIIACDAGWPLHMISKHACRVAPRCRPRYSDKASLAYPPGSVGHRRFLWMSPDREDLFDLKNSQYPNENRVL